MGTPPSPCHYSVLGIKRTASAVEIRKAYKQRALELHPDKNPNGEAAFKLLNKAYSVLNDETQKRKYDSTVQAAATRTERTERADTQSQPNSARSGASAASAASKCGFEQYTPGYNHNATRDFISKIIEQDRAVASHKQDMSFHSWYKKKQEDWKKQEKATTDLKKAQQDKQEREERMAFERAERMKDIERELERQKFENLRKRELEQQVQNEKAREFERKRQAALEEIEREEEKYKAKFDQLGKKWEPQRRAPPPRPLPKQASPLKSNPQNDLSEEDLEHALHEVREQRNTLKRERQARREEEAAAWREVHSLRDGTYDVDSLSRADPINRDRADRAFGSGNIFDWKSDGMGSSGSNSVSSAGIHRGGSAKEALAAARAALEAAERGETTTVDVEPLSPSFEIFINAENIACSTSLAGDQSLNDAFVR